MIRAFIAVMLFFVATTPEMFADVVRVELAERRLAPGSRLVIAGVYATAEGGEPLITETRSVDIPAHGTFTMPLGALAAAAAGPEQRWLGVRVPPGREVRVLLTPSAMRSDVTVHVVTDAAITASGLIESIESGFRFPDGTVQTSAATVSGGVPSVNGIGGAVTVTGAGTATVQTAGSTITVTAPPFGAPVAIGAGNASGSATAVARADHVHAHGDQAGGSLHSTATSVTAGFMSAADKQKLDGALAYVRTVVVSPVPGDDAASGQALLDAVAGISDNGAANPYVVKIEPGVYDIGSTQLSMKPFVDIEGSGQNATYIVSSHGGASVSFDAAAVVGAADAELRQLTIQNTASAVIAAGFFGASQRARVANVTITTTGGSDISFGILASSGSVLTVSDATVTANSAGGAADAIGMSVAGSTNITLVDCRITGKGPASSGTGTNIGLRVTSQSSVVKVEGGTILATGTGAQNTAVSVQPGNVTIIGATLQADTTGSRIALGTSAQSTAVANVFHSRLLTVGTAGSASHLSLARGANSKLHVATSQIDSASTGDPKCVHVFDADMDDLNNQCPGPIG